MPIKTSYLFFSTFLKYSFVFTLLASPPATHNLNAIYQHPFNKELFSGHLSPKIFSRYLKADEIYLKQFAQTLIKLSAQSPPSLQSHLLHLAQDIISDEQKMQKKYSIFYRHQVENSIVISQYIQFVREAQNKELPVALSTILPCFFIYYQLGLQVKTSQLINNPYRKWLETYISGEFTQATLELINITNSLYRQADPKLRAKMRGAFAQGVDYELAFFNELLPAPLIARPARNNLLRGR